MPMIFRIVLLLSLIVNFSSVDLAVAENGDDDLRSTIEELQTKIQRQQSIIQQQQQTLNQWHEILRQQSDTLKEQQSVIDVLQQKTGTAAPDVSKSDATDLPADIPPEKIHVGPQPEAPERPEISVLAETGGVLLHKGQAIIEPSVEYSHTSVHRVQLTGFTVLPAILLGSIDISKTNRNTLVGALTTRFGITNRIEADIRIPYVYRHDSTLTREPLGASYTETRYKAESSDLGDIEFGLHYQINNGGRSLPYFIANLRAKSNTGTSPFDITINSQNPLGTELATGTGYWSLEPSLTWILPSDPAVLFGNLNYTWNIKEDVGNGYGTYDPGDSIGFNLGTGLSLNEKLSLTLGYEHSFILKSKLNGESIEGTETLQIGSLQLGGTYKLTADTSLSFTVAVGVTEDAPDVRILFRLPIRYSFLGG